ncbi:hypothetical protein ACFQE1_03545 [Halobium palmae]|uniref:Uncharacterized protein n=1 Tax=Halobium palmae TaxID=1776492 RepID=A0ABD5RWT9_9EURY
MTRSRMVLYEAKQILIPDSRELSSEECGAIRSALNRLLEKEEELAESVEKGDELDLLAEKEDERDELDHAVLSTMGMADRVDELKQSVESLVQLRREGSGEQTTVLVNRTGEKEVIELEGVESARESTRLTDFS